jgi:hypothetical protein
MTRRIPILAIAAAFSLGLVATAPAAAQMDRGHDNNNRGDHMDGRGDRHDNGHHNGWRNNHRHQVCQNVWRHHHRQRVCSWR